MAVITKDQVLAILKAPISPEITAMRAEHKLLLMHIHGIGTSEWISQIEGLENSTKIALRKKLARSNKDLFADILRPTDKIFNSQGGSKNYTFKSKSLQDAFKQKLTTIVDGYSLTQWLQMFFIDKLVSDPNGLFFVEHKDSKAYPTYKSTYTIRQYKTNGRGVEWVIFEPIEYKQNERLFKKVRVYDGQFDYMYQWENEILTLLEEETYPNPWGYVPAFTCSDIINPLTGLKKSTIHEQIELANEYLRDNTIRMITKTSHGFPIYWMYAPTCTTCKGSGYVANNVCPSCNGSKHSIKKDVTDIIFLKQPESSDSPTIAPNIAGYVLLPIDTLKYMREDLREMRDDLYYGHWGTIISRDTVEKTAFEVALNTQPMQDRLNQYTNSLESTEKYFVDIIAEYEYKGDYEGCSISYGKNYIIKSPNQYLTEYLEEKGKNASYSVLNSKLEMYYNALYANDEYNRVYHLKIMYVEPFVHNSIADVINWNIPNELKYPKMYFNDWISATNDDDIIKKDIPSLQAELSAFVNGKYKPKT